MKRLHVSLAEVADLDNLFLATWKAARGKYNQAKVRDYISQIDNNLIELATDILQAKVPYGRYKQFYIHDPKLRLIHAACFEDRVLHHSMMNLAEPVFERTLVATTYACRPNKGVHKAILQVQKNIQRFPWFVKVDVKHYFASIDHNILFALLKKRFKGQGFLMLLNAVINWHSSQLSKGLPIGSLTSQHFANFYLDGADRFLQEHHWVCAQVRYMDDMIWWCMDKQSAKQVLNEFQDYLLDTRLLLLKSNTQVNLSQRGVTFCGNRILPGMIRLTPRKKRRYQMLREKWEHKWVTGQIDSLQLQQGYAAVKAMTAHTESTSWCKQNLQVHPCPYITGVG